MAKSSRCCRERGNNALHTWHREHERGTTEDVLNRLGSTEMEQASKENKSASCVNEMSRSHYSGILDML
jgi:hypothetical protein